MKRFDQDEERRLTIVPRTEQYGAFLPVLVLRPDEIRIRSTVR